MSFQGDSIYWVEVDKIVPNPFQPRREFEEARLKELAESIRMYGILQPLTVTRKEVQNDNGAFRTEYELIAGERRLRASKLAGLEQVPVIIRDGEQSEQEKLELAIIENLQREDLNAVDRALAFRQLADVFGLPYAQVARKVGRSREYVSNTVRLLGLPDYMLDSLRVGDISEGHARTLLMLNDRPEEQDTVFREILLKKLSVREVERIARSIAQEKVRKRETLDVELVEMEKKFTESLGTRVSIVKTDYGGRLTIDYFSSDDLEVLLARLKDEATQRAEIKIAPGSLRADMESMMDRDERSALEQIEDTTPLEILDENKSHVFISQDNNQDKASVFKAEQPIEVSAAAISQVPSTSAPTTATIVPEVAPKSSEPEIERSVPTSTLRSQLASIVGQLPNNAQPTTTPVPVVPPAGNETQVTISSTASKSESEDIDDSNLYSINKFTI
jgi:ParB family transcriptional regulator, chromosome partitioning protein